MKTYGHTHTHTYTHTHTHIHIHIHTHTYTHTYTHTHTYIHTYIYTYIHTYIYTYTHTHIYTYTHTIETYGLAPHNRNIWPSPTPTANQYKHMAQRHIIETYGPQPNNRNIWPYNSQATAAPSRLTDSFVCFCSYPYITTCVCMCVCVCVCVCARARVHALCSTHIYGCALCLCDYRCIVFCYYMFLFAPLPHLPVCALSTVSTSDAAAGSATTCVPIPSTGDTGQRECGRDSQRDSWRYMYTIT